MLTAETCRGPAAVANSKMSVPDGSKTLHEFHGLTTKDTNDKNQTRTVTKDSQGQLVSVTDAAGKTTSYAYDPFGKLIKTTDPVGNVVTATYDVRGRKIASSDPDLGAWDLCVRYRGRTHQPN